MIDRILTPLSIDVFALIDLFAPPQQLRFYSTQKRLHSTPRGLPVRNQTPRTTNHESTGRTLHTDTDQGCGYGMKLLTS